MSYNPYTEMLMNQGDYNSAFNAAEADINRSWSEYMSNTQHQREVADLEAAGINPILSANNGAQWTAVGNASSDASIATTMLNNAAALQMSKINAEATKAAANATAGAAMAAAATSAAATRYAADKNYDTATESAWINKGSSWAGVADKYVGSLITKAAEHDWSTYTGY